MKNHEIEYEIFGDDMQYVELVLDPGETAISEPGVMMFMEEGVELEAIMGDGSDKYETLGAKILGTGKRLLSGEGLFMTSFTNRSQHVRHVAFSSPFPGKIIPLDLEQLGGTMICKQSAFLCSAKGVSIDMKVSSKIGFALFSGNGPLFQKLEGDGLAFICGGGTVRTQVLEQGERLQVDALSLLGFTPSISYSIERVKGIKSMLFGGEGMFITELQGPGIALIQSLPFERMISNIIPYLPSTPSKNGGFEFGKD